MLEVPGDLCQAPAKFENSEVTGVFFFTNAEGILNIL